MRDSVGDRTGLVDTGRRISSTPDQPDATTRHDKDHGEHMKPSGPVSPERRPGRTPVASRPDRRRVRTRQEPGATVRADGRSARPGRFERSIKQRPGRFLWRDGQRSPGSFPWGYEDEEGRGRVTRETWTRLLESMRNDARVQTQTPCRGLLSEEEVHRAASRTGAMDARRKDTRRRGGIERWHVTCMLQYSESGCHQE